jgi:sugar lactone lactonase YvrE
MLEQRVLRLDQDGELTLHADLAGTALGPCNDMVVSSNGTAYVGNFGYNIYAGEQRHPGSVVKVDPDGAVEVVAEDFGFPNGSVITPNGKTLIIGESFGRCYTAFTIGDDGSLHDRRQWADLGKASPDGCSLDEEGAIWFASPGGKSVVRVLEGGTITHEIPMSLTPYACALGGADGRTLYVTTATGFQHHEVAGKGTGIIFQTRVDVPHAGLP